ncbi:MAG: TraR/DksA C4-type zinc finger protein [Candidatus Nomurabacteria bacterium]|nr:TraR/DksA C4-type zinc finger protein [Candidatus Nomurabacteria bacterium]
MNLNIYKNKLEDEKKLLVEELGTLGKVDKTGDWEATPDTDIVAQDVSDEADMSERAEDYEERSMKLNSLESRLSDINKALENIGAESYGFCENCKKEIEEDRLEANPAALTCKECMEKVF